MIIADHSATAKVTLWEEHNGTLVENSSYKLTNFQVREYAAVKSLSSGREGSQIQQIKLMILKQYTTMKTVTIHNYKLQK